MKRSKDNPKAALVWRTRLSGVPSDSVRCTREFHSKLATFGNSGRPLRYNSPDCPVCQAEQRSSTPTIVCNATVNSEQCNCPRRSQSRRQKAHRTVNSDCPVAHMSEAPTVGTQWLGDVAGTPDSVRWRTGLSGAPYDRSPHQRPFWCLGL
jgi:hypothetical protein